MRNEAQQLACLVLGASPHASHAEVEAAWRRLARDHHPDRGGDAETFRRLRAAWALLEDDDAATAHDPVRVVTVVNAHPWQSSTATSRF